MKNISLYILALLTLFMVSCEPNKELYEQLDAVEVPYSKAVTYTFTTADYTEFAALVKKYHTTTADTADAKDIDAFKSFSPDRPIDTYPLAVDAFFRTKFIALDSSSSVELSTDYSDSHILVPTPTTDTVVTKGFEYYVLSAKDYANLGGVMATYNYIPAANLSTLTNYIKSKIYPTAVADDYVVISFNYFDGTISYTEENYYVFNGNYWKSDDTKLSFTKADYTEMGATAGVGYFTSSYKSTTYIPLFLKKKYPYALPNDKKTVLYRYFVSATEIQVHQATFVFNGSTWSEKNSKTETFFNTGTAWMYDITKRFTMMAADYQILADWTKVNHPTYFNDVYKNEEYHFGANAYYRNFNLKLATRRSKDVEALLPTDDTEAMAFMETKILEGVVILLETKYPTLEPQTGGIDQYVEVTYMVYYGTNPSPYFKTRFKCTETGKFEPIEENPTVQVK